MKQNDVYEVDGCTDFIPVKLIKEHKHLNLLEVASTESGYRAVVPHMYSFPKVNEPQKPVIPKFVAEWIEKVKKIDNNLDVWLRSGDGIIMIENKGERLTTLGFGIPNLSKLGEVGYFPEQFIVDFGLQGKTASEIQRYFISTGMDFDGDIMSRVHAKIHYFVDLKHNVFIKYDVNEFGRIWSQPIPVERLY